MQSLSRPYGTTISYIRILTKQSKAYLIYGYRTSYPRSSMFNFNTGPFKEHYRDVHEELPFRMPEPLDNPATTTTYVDASHAANKITRRSHTGFILFVVKAPTIWYSKRQNTVKNSTFSSEFIAMKYCVDAIHVLR